MRNDGKYDYIKYSYNRNTLGSASHAAADNDEATRFALFFFTTINHTLNTYHQWWLSTRRTRQVDRQKRTSADNSTHRARREKCSWQICHSTIYGSERRGKNRRTVTEHKHGTRAVVRFFTRYQKRNRLINQNDDLRSVVVVRKRITVAVRKMIRNKNL